MHQWHYLEIGDKGLFDFLREDLNMWAEFAFLHYERARMLHEQVERGESINEKKARKRCSFISSFDYIPYFFVLIKKKRII